MARIRTIKPDFFTSEDIIELSPLARLLYIAIWCEADREGRLAWKPKTFKIRYLPADNCDINELCREIVDRGLVVLYGDGLACIPSFSKHQHINPRETASILPEPSRVDDASARIGDDFPSTPENHGKARVSDASSRDSDVQVGNEGKEIDNASKTTRKSSPKKISLPADFGISDRVREWAGRKGYVDLESHLEYFKGKSLAKGYTYADWDEGFMGAIREDWAKLRSPSPASQGGFDPSRGAI